MQASESNMASDRDTDGGWAWVVLVLVSLAHVIEANAVISVGLFQVEFLNQFSGSIGFTSLLSSIFIGLQLMMGPVASVLCNVFSIRVAMMTGALLFSLGLISASFASSLLQLFITFSVIGGTGFGLVYTPLNVVIGHYFVRRRAVANGISLSSVGVGFAVGPYITVWLMENFGWRFALSILACSILQFCVTAAACFPSKSEIASRRQRPNQQSAIISKKSSKRSEHSRLWFLCHPHWWIFCMNYAFQMIAWAIHVVHFPSFAESQDVPLDTITSLFTAFGITLSLSRLLCGFLCNDDSVDPLVVMIGVQGLQGLTTIFMPFYGRSYTGLLMYQIAMSLFCGASFVPITPLAVQLFGVDRLATVFGWVMMWGGLGSLVGPVVAGWIRDVSLSYSLGFHIAGLFSIAGSSILLLIPSIMVKDESMVMNKEEMLIHEDQTVIVNDVFDDETGIPEDIRVHGRSQLV